MVKDWSAWKARASDPRTWILLFFLLRLIGITNAPTEIGHAWRQCLTAMIARNLNENGFDLLHPEVDMGGNGSGVIGAEFPLLNALIALVCRVLGPAHWYGRLIVLIVSSFGTMAFARVVRTIFGDRTALIATLLLLTSVWFQFSRKIMPDTFSVPLVLVALDQAVIFLRKGDRRSLIAFSLFMALGAISKMPALTLAPALLVPLLLKQAPLRRAKAILLFSAPAFLVTVLWYFSWVPHLVATYHYPLYFPRSLAEGAKELWQFRSLTASMFYFEAFRSFLLLPFLVLGCWFFVHSKPRAVIWAATSCFAIFFVFMLKAGEVFAHHSYYIVPLVPVLAVIAAFGVERLPVRWSHVVVAVICIEALFNQLYDLRSPSRRDYLLHLEELADDMSRRSDRVIVNGGLDPTWMYFLHRKGWSIPSEDCTDGKKLDSLAALGARRLFLFDVKYPRQDLPLLYQDDHVSVFDVTGITHP